MLGLTMESRTIDAELVLDAIRSDEGWLYVPVRLPLMSDAYEKAILLQEMEDGWNLATPAPETKLSLLPASRAKGSDPRSQENAAYRAAFERQKDALEHIVKNPESLKDNGSKEVQEAREAYDEAVRVLEQVGSRHRPVRRR
jgi:hypothetical protein